MKRFLETKFILLIKDSPESGVDTLILEKEYEAFATFLFRESKSMQDKNDFYNAVSYAQVEIESLRNKKKRIGNQFIYRKGAFSDKYAERTYSVSVKC